MQEQPSFVNSELLAFFERVSQLPESKAAQRVAARFRQKRIAAEVAAAISDDAALDAAYASFWSQLTTNGKADDVAEVRGQASPVVTDGMITAKRVVLWVRSNSWSHTIEAFVRAIANPSGEVQMTVEEGKRSKDDPLIHGPPGFRSWMDGATLDQAGWVRLPRTQEVCNRFVLCNPLLSVLWSDGCNVHSLSKTTAERQMQTHKISLLWQRRTTRKEWSGNCREERTSDND